MAPQRACNTCGKLFSSRSTLWVHKNTVHKNALRYKPHETIPPEENSSSSTDDNSSILQIESGKKRRREEKSNEEIESDEGQCESGEDSEIENSDEIDQDVNYESETETSESDGEEEDEMSMAEEDKQETMIDWPLSRTYKITYPWSFWSEMPRIKKHIRWLERLKDVEQSTVIYNIQNASNSQLGALCEIAYNCVKGHIPLERWNLKELRRQRRAVRLLSNPDVDMEDKREELLRRGANFVEILLHTIDPLIIFNIPRSIKAVIPMEEDDEEEEDINDH